MRSIAVTFLLIGLLVAGMGYGTWAVYHDEETSTGNYVQAGTLDIHLEDGGGIVEHLWLWFNAFPGQTEPNYGNDGEIKIYNDGSLPGDHIEIAFNVTCYEDDNGDIFAEGTLNYDPSKHVSGPESDTNQSGVGNWLDQINVTLVYQDRRNPWLPHVFTVCKGCTLRELIEKVIIVPVPAQEGYNILDFDINGIMETGEPQNDWQGDVCELIIRIGIAQEDYSQQQIFTTSKIVVYKDGDITNPVYEKIIHLTPVEFS